MGFSKSGSLALGTVVCFLGISCVQPDRVQELAPRVDAPVEPGTIEKPGPGGVLVGDLPFMVITLILRQKCQYWKLIGFTPLPSYCNQLLKSSGVTLQILSQAYQHYKKVVPLAEQTRDLRLAKEQLGLASVAQAL